MAAPVGVASSHVPMVNFGKVIEGVPVGASSLD